MVGKIIDKNRVPIHGDGHSNMGAIKGVEMRREFLLIFIMASGVSYGAPIFSEERAGKMEYISEKYGGIHYGLNELLRRYENCELGGILPRDYSRIVYLFEMTGDGRILEYFGNCGNEFSRRWEKFYDHAPFEVSGGSVVDIGIARMKISTGGTIMLLRAYTKLKVEETPIRVEIDTGSPYPLAIDSKLLPEGMLENAGFPAQSGKLIPSAKVEVGDAVYKNLWVDKIKDLDTNENSSGLPDGFVRGIMGLPMLTAGRKAFEFDFKSQSLIFDPDAPITYDYEFGLKLDGRFLVLHGNTIGGDFYAIVDTGSKVPIIMGDDKYCIAKKGKVSGAMKGYSGVRTDYVVESCTVNLMDIPRNVFSVDSRVVEGYLVKRAYGMDYSGYDAIIGMGFFSEFSKVRFDLEHAKLFLAR